MTTGPVLPNKTPTIPTRRLILRPLHESDLAAYHKIRTSPAVMKFSQLQRPDPDIAFTKMKLDPSLPPQNRTAGTETYLLGVEERSNPGTLIGDTGCHDASPGTEEVGYMFLDDFWGKGYATEALQAFLGHYWGLERRADVRGTSGTTEEGTSSTGKEEAGKVQPNAAGREEEEENAEIEVLRALAQVENGGSLNVLRKCGFRETRRYLHESGAWRVALEMQRPAILSEKDQEE